MAIASASNSTFGDLQAWQSMLDASADSFSEMRPGSAVGFVARAGDDDPPGIDGAAPMEADGEGEMLVWEIADGGMRARLRRYPGLREPGVDLLFVAEAAALGAMREAMPADGLAVLKRQIRRGGIMFYVMRTKRELLDAGYEEFLDNLGLAFLGACR